MGRAGELAFSHTKMRHPLHRTIKDLAWGSSSTFGSGPRFAIFILLVYINCVIFIHLNLEGVTPSMAASAGETDRDLAWTQLAQKLGVYNII